MPDIYSSLNSLAESDMYPFHMPGHKRNDESTPLKGAFRCDITEIDDFDNLHAPDGIILEAQKRANALYGAEETFFLVNGSTCGVLAAVSAAIGENEHILAARGSHKSFYHGAYLRRLKVDYLPYKMDSFLRIPEPYNAGEIEAAIKEDTKAVFITSPTYEGRCSDIKAIADVCHKRNIPLIVDAAHGAHFGFGETSGIPESAVNQGADIVIHSVHKTLNCMTQTALLHVQGKLVDRERLKRFLRIYQSSSPSYVLMSSIDLCMKELEDHGKEIMDRLVNYRQILDRETADCQSIRIYNEDRTYDPGKVLIYDASGSMTGQQIYDILREDFRLQLEMAGERSALAIVTGWDTKEGIDRLAKALREIDRKITEGSNGKSKSLFPRERNVETIELPQKAMKINEAWDSDSEIVPLEEAKNRIAADFVNLYPPGIPLIVPGEVVSGEFTEDIKRYLSIKLNVQGVLDIGNKGIIDKRGILCVKQK